MDVYRNLLAKINTNIQNQMPLPYISTTEYNIFSLLGVAAKEVIMCRFLADLLNPEGMHGCGIVFLMYIFSISPAIVYLYLKRYKALLQQSLVLL